MIIGVISDTHGLLRPEALGMLAGCERIIHAGDVGAEEIVEKLNEIAPVTAVRGNIDTAAWARTLPETAVLEAGELQIYVLHDLSQLDLKPEAAGFSAVVSGHSHQPLVRTQKGVLYFNPGSAGPRRFKLPVSVGRLRIEGKKIEGELLRLKV